MERLCNFFRSWMAVALVLTVLGWMLPHPLLAAEVKLSTLVDENRATITSDDFAKLISDNLIKNGASNVKDAKFFFQECYGGGMLSPLETAFGTTVVWVGGSASTPAGNNPLYGTTVGQLSPAENALLPAANRLPAGSPYVAIPPNPPQDFWTKALIPQLNTANQTVINSLVNAASNDQAANGTVIRFETPQFLAKNGADLVTLSDPTAASHHAILWAGFTDRLRHFTDVDNMITTLKTQWAGTPFTINVLYGDGVHETLAGPTMGVNLPASWNQGGSTVQSATLANLTGTVQNVAKNLSPSEQFLFYAGDHGGVRTLELLPAPRVVQANAHDIEHLNLTDGELLGLQLQQRFGATLPHPSLTVDYSDLTTTAASVFLNGVLLGSLVPNQDTTTFPVPVGILLSDNTIDIFNAGLSSFTLLEKFFDTGGIDSNPVPLPPSALLLGSGLLGLLGMSWRRRN